MLGALIHPVVYFSTDARESLYRRTEFKRVIEGADIGGIQFHIFENGYAVFDTDNKVTATVTCNSIFLALSLVTGRSCLPMFEEEFNKVRLTPQGDVLNESKIGSLRNAFVIFREWRRQWEKEWKTTVYPESVARDMVELGSLIHDSQYRPIILTFYYAWSDKDRGDWTGSYWLSWTCIEMMIFEELRLHLSSQSVRIELTDAILKSWRLRNIIEYFSNEIKEGRMHAQAENEFISAANLKELGNVRDIRNRIVHKGYRPTSDETLNCYALAERTFHRCMFLSGIDYRKWRSTPVQTEGKASV